MGGILKLRHFLVKKVNEFWGAFESGALLKKGKALHLKIFSVSALGRSNRCLVNDCHIHSYMNNSLTRIIVLILLHDIV